MNIYALGHDFGNSETDDQAYYRGSWLSANMPTVESTFDGSKFDQIRKKMAPNSAMIRMAGNDTYYLIGEEVLIQKPDAMSHRGNIGRYSSHSSLRALLANACRMIPDKNFGILVTTGVPVDTYIKDKTIRDTIPAGLNGTYTCQVTYHDKDGEIITQERTVFVQINKVVMEGAGAILAHGEGGEVRQVAIDIGGGTTDIYTTRGQKPLVDRCASKDIGVEYSLALLKDNFLATYKRELEQGEVREMLLASIGVRAYPSITVKGKNITSHQQVALVEEAIRVVGEQIQSFVASTLKEGQTADSVALSIKNVFAIGRGTIFFLPYLKEIISKDQLKIVEDPGKDNALGYAMFSRRALTSNTASIAS